MSMWNKEKESLENMKTYEINEIGKKKKKRTIIILWILLNLLFAVTIYLVPSVLAGDSSVPENLATYLLIGLAFVNLCMISIFKQQTSRNYYELDGTTLRMYMNSKLKKEYNVLDYNFIVHKLKQTLFYVIPIATTVTLQIKKENGKHVAICAGLNDLGEDVFYQMVNDILATKETYKNQA